MLAAFDAGSSHFTVEQRDGRILHRESRTDESGRTLAEVEAEITYALGSGSRGTAYLVERAGRLYQSPITWYGQKQRWDLSTGYEQNNLHFDRPIEPKCLFCHSNRVVPAPMSVNRYEEPIFRGQAIGCERCHGPGALHVRGREVVEGWDLTIVNPRHLEPSLREDVCEQCHLLGDHRVERLGRGTFDFRPGFPTSDFFAVFERTSNEQKRAVGQVEQMKLSRCYQKSKGLLGCISCHDPHRVPEEKERAAFFRGRCLVCHEQSGCKLALSTRLTRSPDDNCVSCHMPASTNTDIVHVAATDHRILKTPESQESARPSPPEGATPLRLVNGDDSGAGDSEPLGREMGIALAFEAGAYANTPLGRQLGLRALHLLDRALAEQPDDFEVKRLRARALALAGRRREAVDLQREILEIAPTYEQVLEEFTQFTIELRDSRPAIAQAARAVALNPGSSDRHERLAYLLCQAKDWDGALRESRESLRLNPFRRFARMFLIESLLHRNDTAGAEVEAAKLVRLHPNERSALEQWYAEKLKSQGR
jgi:hypothetical protein